MQPGRQERVRVNLYGSVVRDATLIEKSLKPASLVCIEDIGTPADKFARNENLRNRGHRSASTQCRTDFSAAIVSLIFHRVEINRTICNAVFGEHLANCPAK